MISFIDLLVVIWLFLLRFGVPALVIVGIGYFLKRLDARWEAEARAQRAAEAAEQPVQQPGVGIPKPAERPATPKRAPLPQPLPQQPFIIPPAAQRESIQAAQPGLMAQKPAAHCWDVKQCSTEKRANCAAPQHPGLPCWQARFDAEGKIPEDCVNCDTFQRYPLM